MRNSTRKRTLGNSAKKVGELMAQSVQTVRPEDDVALARQMMIWGGHRHLPVVHGNKLVGIVSSTDLLPDEGHFVDDASSLTASDVMSAPPLLARVDDPLRCALRAMIENDVRHLPVIDRQGKLVGMLSDRDVRAALGDPLEVLERGPTPGIDEMDVESVMTVDALALRPDAPIREVAACLLQQRLGAVPVIDERERVVGIVSYVDLLRQMMMSLG